MQRDARWLGSPGLAVAVILAVAGLVASSCDKPIGPVDPGPLPDPGSGSAVLVGAGDIAFCGSPGTYNTAVQLDGIPGTVFTAGDNAYPHGTAADFAQCYDPTWGRHLDRTYPVLGNHDYDASKDAKDYFDYFAAAVNTGQRGLGYYFYDVGSWRVFALNSELFAAGAAANAAAANTQLTWFKQRLAEANKPCTIAIWHRPLFTSSTSGNGQATDMRDVYKAAYDANVDIVINGHDHNYERFAPQDADARADAARGIRQFVVGTGGVVLYNGFAAKPNSEVRQASWGVLKLTLSSGNYTWEYIPVTGQGSRDTGNGACH